jgi:hypothetical protein
MRCKNEHHHRAIFLSGLFAEARTRYRWFCVNPAPLEAHVWSTSIQLIADTNLKGLKINHIYINVCVIHQDFMSVLYTRTLCLVLLKICLMCWQG